ncbi:MAG: iron-containing alcohol dehydrogenase [Coriobacteriales bacterium]|jgi:alcohol dehydrogenase YqhD (iron-dependent ADH family)
MNDFVFENSTRFHFGKSALDAIPVEVGDAKTIMITYGGGSVKRTGVYDRVVDPLIKAGKKIVDFGGIMSNPTWAKVQEGAKVARDNDVDFIIAIGGGSVMDCSKMIAVTAVDEDENLWDKYFARFASVEVEPLPLGIVVTATGTGSEGNGGAVITNEETKVKTGADRPQMNARFAILDPTLTFTVPAKQKAASGYDIMNHLMEEYFSKPVGNVIADDLIEATMRSVIENLPVAIAEAENYQAHANIEWASSLAENRVLKCGKSTCFQCHVIEHQIGAYTDCVHGLGLAAITSNYYRHIYNASPDALFQFKRFAVNVWGIDPEGKTDEEVALSGIDALESWTESIGVACKLSDLGCTEDMLEEVADRVPGLPTCFKKLDRDDILDILKDSF